ncbi:MAG: hypothetical protein IJ446_04550 [Oscillospiraceae bacterium]|nr:hypothetical protein [Oscillospiraceae bacterium]
MCKLFEDWSDEIRTYCYNNNLSFDKVQKLSQCWGSNFLALQYHDPEKGKNGLLDDTPMPLVLLISKANNELVFEQTEYTKKYLS